MGRGSLRPMGRLPSSAAVLAALATSLPATAQAQSEDGRFDRMQREIEALKEANATQGKEIESLKAQHGEQWLSQQRAEQIRGVVADVLADSDTRSSLQAQGATAGYDRNFFLASADGNFKLNVRGQLQIRFAYSHVPTAAAPVATQQSANEYGFEIRRAKLFFSGHVVDPSWKYMLEIVFERNGGGGGQSAALDNAYIQKELGGGTFIRAGQWLQQFNQEEMVSSSAQQLVERSLVSQYFTVKYVQGAEIGTQQEWWSLYAGVNDGGGNRSIQVVQAQNLVEWALTARGEVKLAGAWSQFLADQSWIGSDFGAMLGFGINWQRGTGVQGVRNDVGNGTIPGAPGGGEEASLVTMTGDVNLRGSGWSLGAAGYSNVVYAFAPTPLLSNAVWSFGATVQGGVFITKELELAARYEGLWVVDGVQNATTPNALNTQVLNIVTVGANWYISRNQVKLSVDAGYAFNAVKFSTGLFGEGISGTDYRPTLNAATAAGGGEGEVVFRSQVQLLF
jgi:phosphate-selective porin OprO and OprP